ncbi:MAG: arsenate reductase [Spirochaetes bacterium GWF1_31_7]|nr:MAG: arsenate reductase [Spirochaetes bacterium GWE1_32_154]OHD46163.1 MAG: arsenate reductase [Spirochaetes bacterium GWE2_31_10]OHD49905.1 MAG: arsenate reductase [Spirochaetes bacterium GWF1_31_7]HBD93160.1 arsenate reductase ArsC [Spirochaetia bacterium]HBI37721.1 arsenate reductase ArsC [Spirochaetia bacterium]
MSNKTNVLFVCVHNSARSQMAEAFLNSLGADRFHAESAGLEPGALNTYVVKVMNDEGFDISENDTKSVFELLKKNKHFDFVVTVCDEANSERCPIFPGSATRMLWSFPDPSSFKGSDEEILKKVFEVKEQIKARIKQFVKETI